MRRLARILLNALTALSLLLCVVTLVLWVRSYGDSDDVARRDALAIRFSSASARVQVEVVHWRDRPARPETMGWSYQRFPPSRQPAPRPDWRPPGPGRYWSAFGFAYADGPGSRGVWVAPPFWRASVPHWFLVVLSALLPVARARRALRSRRRRIGLCPACGYDLRATPERCPECGTIPARA